MTRLLTTDIKNIPNSLPDYDTKLVAKTGCSLLQLSCHATGVSEKTAGKSLQNTRVAVIPITTGLGLLQGFCEAVAAIANHMGCQAQVCRQTDVSGIAEAIASDVDIVMMADEQRFIALNLNTRKIADNAEATAKGFITALHLMNGSSLTQQRVLVLGCGAVGQNAVLALLKYNYRVAVYDIDPLKSASVLETCAPGAPGFLQQVTDLEEALLDHVLIVDATPAGAFILPRHIQADTMISAPGMPLGLDQAALAAIRHRLIHDPLQIGVATMLTMALN